MHAEYNVNHRAAQQINSEAAIIPFDRSSVPAVREDYTQAIQVWCRTRDTAEALTREEIGGLDKFDRIDAQRKAIILSLAHYYRKHLRSDVAPGVAVVMTLLSDNDKGSATISQPTLAALFGRSRSAIADAQSKLRDDGIIITGRGRYAATYPVIPRAVANSYNHLTWLIDAVCTQDASANCLTGQDDYQSPDGTLRLNQLHDGTLPLKSVNRRVPDNSIVRRDPTQLHYDNSKKERDPREGQFGKVAAAVAATISTAVMPLAVAAHPVQHVRQAPAECWQTAKAQMAAAISSQEANAQRQVWVTSTGGIEIAGAFREEMQKTYPLADVASALAAACPNIKTESGAWNALQLVRRQFGYMQQDALAKDKRAASYGKKPSVASGEKPAKMPQKIWDEIQAGKKC